ncbi:tryptophan halogenase family protein [Asticcacaulis solisilvae]|uniref:tryptophan halogenase family protein n=1 Tax=Asticcacaulis solisilvae TaxID=1217274 RepID=UPI003FD831B1
MSERPGAMRVIIVGGGTAGWITAVSLATLYKTKNLSIVLVESEDIGTVGVGEATVPHIRFFNSKIGIDEMEFMRATAATFKLGIEFCDWREKDTAYVHPFGAYGRPVAGVGFHHHWRRANLAGQAGRICDYSLGVKMAEAGRFAMPDMHGSELNSTYSYAYQFDAGLYARFLRTVSERRGVTRVEGKVIDVECNGLTNDVEAVVLENGQRLEGDLFIDCSGFRGLLIEQTLKTGYEDWSHYLPCDRAWAVPCEMREGNVAYTRATAREAGWQWRIPLQHRVGNGYVFSSRFIAEDEARDALMARLEGPAMAAPKLLKFVTGMRNRSWSHNVVSIGLSSGFLEPLESTSIHLIQLAVTHLVEMMPDGPVRQEDRDEYNRLMRREYESVRDFLILHYHATERRDTDFWTYVRTMEIPASLKYKMDLFRQRGVVVGHKDGFFLEPSWVAVYLGQGIVPEGYDPLSARIPDDHLPGVLDRIQQEVDAAVAAMPSHGDFLEAYCPFVREGAA